MEKVPNRQMVFRGIAAALAAVGSAIGLVGLTVSIQGDSLVGGTWLLVMLGAITLLAFTGAALVIYRPLAAAFAMMVAAGAYAVGLVDYLGGWWDGFGTAVNGGGTVLSSFWSSTGAMLAFQIAVVLLAVGAVLAWFGHVWRPSATTRRAMG